MKAVLHRIFIITLAFMAAPARSEDLSGDALSLLLFGPDNAQKIDGKTFVLKTDKCSPDPKGRCEISTDTLKITGKCTAERRIDERSYWKQNNHEEHSDFWYSIIKYDFGKTSTFNPVEIPNKKGSNSVYFAFSGEKGTFCIGTDRQHGKRASDPTDFKCYPSPLPGLGGLVDVPFLGEGPLIAERARKAAAYYRENSCSGKPF